MFDIDKENIIEFTYIYLTLSLNGHYMRLQTNVKQERKIMPSE